MTELRKYELNTPQYLLYKQMHENQDLDYVLKIKTKYSEKIKTKMSIKEVLKMMDTFIDPSDPDLDVPNSIHAYQTAERIRKKYPQNKELQITGLIHDLGKILFMFEEPNWSIVGDTYVVGCEYPKSIVYYDTIKENKDYNKYDKIGIYKYGCGLDNLHLSYGHDEYLYNVLKENNSHKLTDKYLDIIRYHSFYPWHTGNDYYHFMNEKDKKTLKNILDFNSFDLYSKEDDINISDETKEYYNELLDEYFPEDLFW